MANCVKCGANLESGARFCPECGSMQPEVSQQPPQGYQPPQGAPTYQANYQPQQPQYNQQPQYSQPPQYAQPIPVPPSQSQPQGGEIAPSLTTKQFLGMFAIGLIPIAGFIIYLMWAFGEVPNPNKKSFARGYLLFALIVAGISIVISILVSVSAVSCAACTYGSLYNYYY